MPPMGRFKRFSINLGPQHWTGPIKSKAVGDERLNTKHDYFALISIFPVIAQVVVFDADAMREMHTDRSRFERPPGVRDIIALFGSNVLTTIGREHKRHRSS